MHLSRVSADADAGDDGGDAEVDGWLCWAMRGKRMRMRMGVQRVISVNHDDDDDD